MDNTIVLPIALDKEQLVFRDSVSGKNNLRSQIDTLIDRKELLVYSKFQKDPRDLTVGDAIGSVIDFNEVGDVFHLKIALFKAFPPISQLENVKLKLQGFYKLNCRLVSHSTYELTCVSLSKSINNFL